jgi:hypothetical protein
MFITTNNNTMMVPPSLYHTWTSDFLNVQTTNGTFLQFLTDQREPLHPISWLLAHSPIPTGGGGSPRPLTWMPPLPLFWYLWPALSITTPKESSSMGLPFLCQAFTHARSPSGTPLNTPPPFSNSTNILAPPCSPSTRPWNPRKCHALSPLSPMTLASPPQLAATD